MPGRGKRGKPNSGFPLFPPPLEIARRAISTFPQRRRRLLLSSSHKHTHDCSRAGRARSLCNQRKEPSSCGVACWVTNWTQAHLALESKSTYRLIPRWKRKLVSGSLLVWIGKCFPTGGSGDGAAAKFALYRETLRRAGCDVGRVLCPGRSVCNDPLHPTPSPRLQTTLGPPVCVSRGMAESISRSSSR